MNVYVYDYDVWFGDFLSCWYDLLCVFLSFFVWL